MKVDQNAKKAPKSSKNEMLIFGLCSTSVVQSGSSVISVWVLCYYYYCLSNSDLVRWCCCHVSLGVIPTPRTHMVDCFVLLL